MTGINSVVSLEAMIFVHVVNRKAAYVHSLFKSIIFLKRMVESDKDCTLLKLLTSLVFLGELGHVELKLQ